MLDLEHTLHSQLEILRSLRCCNKYDSSTMKRKICVEVEWEQTRHYGSKTVGMCKMIYLRVLEWWLSRKARQSSSKTIGKNRFRGEMQRWRGGSCACFVCKQWQLVLQTVVQVTGHQIKECLRCGSDLSQEQKNRQWRIIVAHDCSRQWTVSIMSRQDVPLEQQMHR